MDSLKMFGTLIGGIALFIFLILWAGVAVDYHVKNVHVKVFVEEELVFDGRSACVDVASAGYATNVNIMGGWYCVFPKEHYVEKNVRIETVK